MGRMSDLDIALHEGVEEVTEAELLKGIGLRFLKLAELKAGEDPDEKPEDRLTNTYETNESLEAKDAYDKAHPHRDEEVEGYDYPEPEVEKPVAESPKPTLEEVRKVLAELSRDGHTADVRQLILSKGKQRLSEVDPADYQWLIDQAGRIRDGR